MQVVQFDYKEFDGTNEGTDFLDDRMTGSQYESDGIETGYGQAGTKSDKADDADATPLQKDIDTLIDRHAWIANALAEGSITVSEAIDADDAIYDGLDHLLDNADDGDDEEFDDDTRFTLTDKGQIILTATRVGYCIKQLQDAYRKSEVGQGDQLVTASLAAKLMSQVTDWLTENDLILDAVSNPADEERQFIRMCMWDITHEYVNLLAYSTNHYVNAYAISHWLDDFSNEVIGGIESFLTESIQLRQLDNGRWIL